jgi:hypothetical protein
LPTQVLNAGARPSPLFLVFGFRPEPSRQGQWYAVDACSAHAGTVDPEARGANPGSVQGLNDVGARPRRAVPGQPRRGVISWVDLAVSIAVALIAAPRLPAA